MFWTLVRRSWVAFVVMTIAGGIAMMIADGDDPLRSDDPYVAGFLCGGYAAVLGALYTIAEKFLVTTLRTSLCYFIASGLWVQFLLLVASGAREGEDLVRLAAVVFAGVTFFCWPLFAYRTPKVVVVAVTLAGLLIFVLYGVAVVR